MHLFRIVSIPLGIAGLVATSSVFAQSSQQPQVNGMRPADLRAHAIIGATVVTRPGTSIAGATIIIRDGVIEAVGTELAVPPDARQWPGDGMTVYPGLIDAAVLTGFDADPDDVGSHWNGRVHPEFDVADRPMLAESKREQFRSMGFTVAAVYPDKGIFRGTGSIIALGNDDDHAPLYQDRAAMMMGFDYGGGWSSATYPGSLMGSIALIRQTLFDARWHAQCRQVYEKHPQNNEPPAPSFALAALTRVLDGSQPVLFEVSDELNAQRIAAIAREFDLDLILLAGGTEFRRLEETIELNVPMIVPINFPERPGVTTLHEAQHATLRELQTWEQSPTNPRRLVHAGATVALTTHRLKSPSKFPEALRTAIKHGLTEEQALASVTTVPAELLGLDAVIGTIETGKIANLVMVEGSLFEKSAKIRDTWINGRRYEISKKDQIELVGKGELTTSLRHVLTASIDTTKQSFTIERPAADPANAPAAIDPPVENDENKINVDDAPEEKAKKPKSTKYKAKKVVVQRDQVSCIMDGTAFDVQGYAQLSGVIDGDVYKGSGRLPDSTSFSFRMEVTEKDAPEEKQDETDDGLASRDGGTEQGTASPIAGRWNITIESAQMPQPIDVALTIHTENDADVSVSLSMMGQEMELGDGTFDTTTGELLVDSSAGPMGPIQLRATINESTITGTATSEQGESTFSGSREHIAGTGNGDSDAENFEMPPDELNVPLGAYGFTEAPQTEFVLIRGATIWTSGSEGVIEDGDMLVRNGTIEYVGPTVSWAWDAEDAIIADDAPPELGSALHPDEIESKNAPRILDARGMHLTPGLIDCHSHTGIDGGVNEWTQVNTAEVRIGDVIDPDDIDFYRQLAGGLTACNQLHGSANPIGGQNSVVKLKWGRPASEFPVPDAIGGIKFALGENVKRTQSRYPNTRMGVETVIRDAFTAAREYEQRWTRYLDLPSEQKERTMPPARDLELETLVEILNSERIVHCHSYRQDEILMLIRVADSFGFTIGTFQHVLEGYKVAEAIATHGAGASSFSDWWAYKVEVMDAIPYNGSLMNDVGVLVSFNSDSNELARRMNTEAAKAVRYGGMMPSEALKLVTINPAAQLRIDHHTGSLEQGKDADFVLWSGDPLSTYTVCLQTWIEGACYYDQQRNAELEQWAASEHQRLVQKALADAHGAPKSAEPSSDEADKPEPDAVARPTGLLAARIAEALDWMEQQIRAGVDPETLRPGDCGCNDLLWQLMQSEVQR